MKMAINKNDYLDVDGNYDLKKDLVDEVIDEFNSTSSDLNAHVAETVAQGSPHGMPSVIIGSTVRNLTTPATSAMLFNLGELQDMFNAGLGTTPEDYFAIVSNGDSTVTPTHIDGVLWNGWEMRVGFNSAYQGYIRINYMIFYKRP